MSLSDQIKDLIRSGREVGYILESNLTEVISTLSEADQYYIRNTIEGFKIQIIKSKKDYDELKYLSGEDAIKFLQNLSDGKYSAFEKDNKKN
tara:strand:- start:2513 stop:2788 length:276 start_codon:yes stop_codon:yes gene_type:complete